MEYQDIKKLPQVVEYYVQKMHDPEANYKLAREYKRFSAAYEVDFAFRHANNEKQISKSKGRGDSQKK